MIDSFEIGRIASELLTGDASDRELAALLDPARFGTDAGHSAESAARLTP